MDNVFTSYVTVILVLSAEKRNFHIFILRLHPRAAEWNGGNFVLRTKIRGGSVFKKILSARFLD